MDKEILEGNKLIADFNNLKPFEDSRYGVMYTDPTSKTHGSVFGHEGLKYHSSWDWLMPVVKKLATEVIHKDWPILDDALAIWKPLHEELEKINIDGVFLYVVKFIQYTNSLTTKQTD